MAVIGGALCYVFADFGGWPLLMYEPYHHSWLFSDDAPAAVTILYPGMLIYALLGAAVVATMTLLVTSQLKTSLSDHWLQLVGGWALTAPIFSGLYFLWGVWPF